MNDDIDNYIDDVEDDGNNVDADTSLDNLDVSRLNDFNEKISNGEMMHNDSNNPSLFPATNLIRKTADNLAFTEAMVNEKPLKTDKTAELERKEAEEDNDE